MRAIYPAAAPMPSLEFTLTLTLQRRDAEKVHPPLQDRDRIDQVDDMRPFLLGSPHTHTHTTGDEKERGDREKKGRCGAKRNASERLPLS